MEALTETVRAVSSKPMQRAVVNTVLLASSTIPLLFLATLVSALFFSSFVPDQFVTTPVHLQYGSAVNPYGVASLSMPLLKSQQDYDISVTLSMPRSPPNVERGNFMVSLYLLSSKDNNALVTSAYKHANGHTNFGESAVLFHSRRPALVPYVDPVVSLASRTFFLLYHMLFPSSNTCVMNIPLAESLAFPRDAAVPVSAYLEVEAGQGIQIYHAALTMTAQLRGLRWLMFHYRLLTYVTFTTLFWACEMLFMSAAWALWSSIVGGPASNFKNGRNGKRIGSRGEFEDEEGSGDDIQDELLDYPHQFPTYGKQPPLKHEPEVKKEEERQRPLSEIPIAGAEADDEDEFDYKDDNSQWRGDSGIGTSYSEEGSVKIRRRASRNPKE